ncbi:MAG: TonB family protein [Pyrinomonadaceae bacterium]|nr:TonB family protein [Pyrinomonadaceae bacterium]
MLTERENLISAGPSIIRVASNGDADAMSTLLAEGADVDQRGRGGHTALMVAAIFNHVDIARLLLAAGADVQFQDNLGLTAKDWADRRGSWDVAQLLSNAQPLKTESLSEQEAVETWSSPGPTQPQIEEAHAPATEPRIARQPDAVRFMKFHQQIMAAQARRNAEQAHREAEEAHCSTPIETNTARQQDASLQSEQGAVETRSATGATHQVEEVHHASPIETKSSPHRDDHRVADEQRRTKSEPERRENEAQTAATQSARIAATIEHLRLLEESSQRSEGEVPAKSHWPAPTSVGSALDSNDPDTTLDRRPPEISTRPVVIEPKTGESFNPLPVKRCPECNTAYDNPLVRYCAYDAAKLISVDVSMSNNSAARDWSRQTLWVLVAIITVLGASLGYLMNNYRSSEKVASAPIAAISTSPIATQTEQPEVTRNASPLVSGALSGMEVDVPEPEYPAKARAEGVSGTIKVRIQVNKKGRVVLARSSSGDRRLRAAAVAAAQNATFSPEKLAVQGRVLSGTITYNFVAQTESPAATGSPMPAETDSPSATGSSAATGSSVANVGENYPVVGGPLAGSERNLPRPNYPEKAKSKGIYGTIKVLVRVNRAGKVISWRTLEGDSQLRAAALKAAKKATFSPAKLPGSGEVVGTITYNFRL